MYEIMFSLDFLIALRSPLELCFRLKLLYLVKYSLVTFWLHSGYILVAFRLHSGCIPVMFRLHIGCVLGLKRYRWTYVLSAVDVSEDNSL